MKWSVPVRKTEEVNSNLPVEFALSRRTSSQSWLVWSWLKSQNNDSAKLNGGVVVVVVALEVVVVVVLVMVVVVGVVVDEDAE